MYLFLGVAPVGSSAGFVGRPRRIEVALVVNGTVRGAEDLPLPHAVSGSSNIKNTTRARAVAIPAVGSAVREHADPQRQESRRRKSRNE